MHNDSARLNARLDWLLPHLRSVIGGFQLRIGDRDKATTNLRIAVDRMEQSHLKPPAAVLAAARAAGPARRAEPRSRPSHRGVRHGSPGPPGCNDR